MRKMLLLRTKTFFAMRAIQESGTHRRIYAKWRGFWAIRKGDAVDCRARDAGDSAGNHLRGSDVHRASECCGESGVEGASKRRRIYRDCRARANWHVADGLVQTQRRGGDHHGSAGRKAGGKPSAGRNRLV